MAATRRERTPPARAGAALLVVLWTVLVMATVAAAAGAASRRSADVTAAGRATAVARAMAESGIVSGVAAVEQLLHEASDSVTRDEVLRSLESRYAATGLVSDTIDGGAFAVAIVDISARLDVNEAGADGWRSLLTDLAASPGGAWRGTPSDIARLASAISSRALGRDVDGRRAVDDTDPTAEARAAAIDSVAIEFLGRPVGGTRRPFETVDALLDVPGVTPALLEAAAPYLTVDGDGRVNRTGAPVMVQRAAAGSLVDRPVRLLLVSRGWSIGTALTREIEAVYDIEGDRLHAVRWRERDR